MNDCLKLKEINVNFITEYYIRLFGKQPAKQKFAVVQTIQITLICSKN